MQKRLRRLTRRSIVGAIVGLAFAAAAGVGLAQITADGSTTAAAASTTAQSTTDSTSSNSREQTTASSAPSTTTGDEGQGNGQEKVALCHITGSGKSHTINVAKPAIAAHTAHGDTEGACAETTTASVKPQRSTRAHVKKSKPLHVTSHVSHSNKPKHGPHTKPAPKLHGNSGQSHGNSGGGHGNGHGKK